MRSLLAEEIRRKQAEEALALTADERVAAALALGERAIADYMQNFGGDRAAAIRELRRRGQAGRKYSRCLDDSAGTITGVTQGLDGTGTGGR